MGLKTWQDVVQRARFELGQWFIRQTRNPDTKYYLYYLGSDRNHEGGILFCSKPPANPDYKKADFGHIRRDLTVEQNFCRLVDTLRRLPILS